MNSECFDAAPAPLDFELHSWPQWLRKMNKNWLNDCMPLVPMFRVQRVELVTWNIISRNNYSLAYSLSDLSVTAWNSFSRILYMHVSITHTECSRCHIQVPLLGSNVWVSIQYVIVSRTPCSLSVRTWVILFNVAEVNHGLETAVASGASHVGRCSNDHQQGPFLPILVSTFNLSTLILLLPKRCLLDALGSFVFYVLQLSI